MKELFLSSLILALTIRDHIDNFYPKSAFFQDQNPLPGRCNMYKEESATDTQHVALNCKKRTELKADLKKSAFNSVSEGLTLNLDYTFILDVTKASTVFSNNSRSAKSFI